MANKRISELTLHTTLSNNDFFPLVKEGETVRVAYATLKTKIQDLKLILHSKKSTLENIDQYFSPILNGEDIGLLSDSGNPCIADPGSIVVKRAHELNIEVKPLIGPSSILLALMASGMNGQNFAFNGYLPIDKKERIKKTKEVSNNE